MTTERYYTPEQMAAEFAISPSTIRRLIQRGEIDATRVGRSFRIRQEDIDRIVIDDMLAIAERHPDVDGDALLEELEREDEQAKTRIK